jgi:hypothetical protein
MEVGDIYFPFVSLSHHIFCLTFIICKSHHGIFAGYLVLSDGVRLDCLGGVIDIPESRERGNGGG